MAGGYEKGFTIEYVPKEKRRLSCSDCDYYDKYDKSCGKSPRYLPVDGYDSWKYCGQFIINPKACFKDEKEKQYAIWIKRKASRDKENDNKNNKGKNISKESNKTIKKSTNHRYLQTNYKDYSHEKNTSSLSELGTKDKYPMITEYELKSLMLKEINSKKEVPLPKYKKRVIVKINDTEIKALVYIHDNYAYYNKNCYDASCIEKLKKMFKN